MESSDKVRLSTDFFFMNVFIIISIIFCAALLREANITDAGTKTLLEYKLMLLTLIILLAYFMNTPGVYYDDTNLYVKRLTKKGITIPLKNIVSIFSNPIFRPKNGYNYSIEYNNKHEINSIGFMTSYWNTRMAKFIELIKKINPAVEIV